MVSLKEFLKESLKQIADAAVEFDKERWQERGDEKISAVATTGPATLKNQEPDPKAWAQHGMIYLGRRLTDDPKNDYAKVVYATVVEFDVAVSAEEAEQGGKGVGVNVFSAFSGDLKQQQSTTNTSVSRINFKIALQIN